ncbi:MAG: DUF2059 domain-containing protein [Flavobacteriales bacterium]
MKRMLLLLIWSSVVTIVLAQDSKLEAPLHNQTSSQLTDSLEVKKGLMMELMNIENMIPFLASGIEYTVPESVDADEFNTNLQELADKTIQNYMEVEGSNLINELLEYDFNTFTVNEFEQLVEFYSTALGKKVLEQQLYRSNALLNSQLEFEKIKLETVEELFPSEKKSGKKKKKK